MGKKKSTTTNKPIYSAQVEGAANTLTGAYNQAAPGLQQGADQFGGIREGILARFNSPDNPLNAARSHYSDVLSGKYLTGNPELQNIIDSTGNDVANGISAGMGTRGQTGGSAQAGILSRELAKNASGLRYQDYNTQQGRIDNAASSVGSLGQAESAMLDPAIRAYQAQTAPLLAAGDYAGGIGGLLGQYQTQKTTQSGGLGQLLAGLGGSALSGWASGGFKGV